MRRFILPLFLAFASLGGVAHADEGDSEPQAVTVASPEPFRAALMANMTVAARAMATMGAMAKHPVPKALPVAQRKIYNEQSAWLKMSATRLRDVHVKMQQVAKKGTGAGATEIASVNMEFVKVRDEIEQQSHRYETLKARTTPALESLKQHDAAVLAALTH